MRLPATSLPALPRGHLQTSNCSTSASAHEPSTGASHAWPSSTAISCDSPSTNFFTNRRHAPSQSTKHSKSRVASPPTKLLNSSTVFSTPSSATSTNSNRNETSNPNPSRKILILTLTLNLSRPPATMSKTSCRSSNPSLNR